MNEIIKIIGYVLFLILFRYISWIKLIAVSLLYNGLQYCYNNKKNLHRFIDKQNKNLTIKKAFVIIIIGTIYGTGTQVPLYLYTHTHTHV